MQAIPASCWTSTPPVRMMRRCPLMEAPPTPQGETVWSWTAPMTSVAAPNPWTVPVPVMSSSTIPRFGVTETGVAVKVASSLPLAGTLAGGSAAKRGDPGGIVANAGAALPSRTAAMAAAPRIPAVADVVRARCLLRRLPWCAGGAVWQPGPGVRVPVGSCWVIGFIVASSVAWMLPRGCGSGREARIGQPRRFRAGGSLDLPEPTLGLLALQQAGPLGEGGGLDPVGHAELAQDGGDVDAGGLGADVQLGADLGVGAPGRQQLQDGQLTAGEPVARAHIGRGCGFRGSARRRWQRDAGPLRQCADLRQQRRVAVGGGRGGPQRGGGRRGRLAGVQLRFSVPPPCVPSAVR